MDAVMTCLRRTLLSSPKQRGVSYPIRYSTLFWLFMLGSVAGFVLEGLCASYARGIGSITPLRSGGHSA